MKALGLSLLALLARCHLSSSPPAPSPLAAQDWRDGQADSAPVMDARRTVAPTKADSGYRDDDGAGDACGVACLNLWRLGCPEAERNAASDTCAEVCRKSLSLLNVSCVSTAKTQSAVRLCQVRCDR